MKSFHPSLYEILHLGLNLQCQKTVNLTIMAPLRKSQGSNMAPLGRKKKKKLTLHRKSIFINNYLTGLYAESQTN